MDGVAGLSQKHIEPGEDLQYEFSSLLRHSTETYMCRVTLTRIGQDPG